jgi:hypothetical protein
MPIPGRPHRYGPWFGGVDFSLPPEEIGPNAMSNGQDVRVGVGGQGESRKGTTPYNATAISGGAAYTACGQHEFTASSSKEFAINGANFYEGTSGTWTDRTNSNTITAGNDKTWSFANANGTLIGHNGVSGDIIIKWAAAGNIAALGVSSRFTWAKWWEFFDNRAWAANASTGTDEVWHSDIAAIETWGDTSIFQIGEIVTGIKSIGGLLAVHSENGITGLFPTGSAVAPYSKRPLGSAGTASGRSIVTVQLPDKGELQVFVRKDGIYAFNGVDSVKISGRLDGDRFWGLVDQTRVKQSFAEHYDLKNEVWFYLPVAGAVGVTQTIMNKILVYDYQRNIFYPPWVGGLNEAFNCAGNVDGIPYSGDLSDGFLYKHETGQNDTDGTTSNALVSYFTTGSPPPEGADVTVRWLYAKHGFDILGDYEVSVTYSSPGIPGSSTTFNQGGGFDAIGTFIVGTGQIAPDILVAHEDTDLTGYDPTLQLEFRNANFSEELSVRNSTAIYKPIGRQRKPKAGVT